MPIEPVHSIDADNVNTDSPNVINNQGSLVLTARASRSAGL